MTCICCGGPGPCIQSHVISKFIRRACTGVDDPITGNTRYDFIWKDEAGPRRSQDLPKPRLMCAECDGWFGKRIETRARESLMPNGFNPLDASTYHQLDGRLDSEGVAELGGAPVTMGVYRDDGTDDDYFRQMFSVLVGWRALHAMADSERTGVAANYLRTPTGLATHNATLAYLLNASPNDYLVRCPTPVRLYIQARPSAGFIAGAEDRLPFATALFQTSGAAPVAIFVAFATWVIIWSLVSERSIDEPLPRFKSVRTACFVDWHAALVRDLKE